MVRGVWTGRAIGSLGRSVKKVCNCPCDMGGDDGGMERTDLSISLRHP